MKGFKIQEGCQFRTKDRSRYQINQYALLSSVWVLQNKQFWTLMYVFTTNSDANWKNLGGTRRLEAISEMPAVQMAKFQNEISP